MQIRHLGKHKGGQHGYSQLHKNNNNHKGITAILKRGNKSTSQLVGREFPWWRTLYKQRVTTTKTEASRGTSCFFQTAHRGIMGSWLPGYDWPPIWISAPVKSSMRTEEAEDAGLNSIWMNNRVKGVVCTKENTFFYHKEMLNTNKACLSSVLLESNNIFPKLLDEPVLLNCLSYIQTSLLSRRNLQYDAAIIEILKYWNINNMPSYFSQWRSRQQIRLRRKQPALSLTLMFFPLFVFFWVTFVFYVISSLHCSLSVLPTDQNSVILHYIGQNMIHICILKILLWVAIMIFGLTHPLKI